MANNGRNGSGSSEEFVGNEPRREEETLGVQTGSQSTGEGSTGSGVMITPVGNPPTGGSDENQASGSGRERRAALSQVGASVDTETGASPAAAVAGGVGGDDQMVGDGGEWRAAVGRGGALVDLETGVSPAAAAAGGEDQMGEEGVDQRAPVDVGGALVDQVAEGSPAAAEAGGDGGGLTEATLYEAIADLDQENPRIGTHEPISARTTGSSTTEAAGEEPIIEDVEEEGAEVEEMQRDPLKGKTPITDEGSERQIAEGLPRRGVAFVPPQGSSAARPTYYDDFV